MALAPHQRVLVRLAAAWICAELTVALYVAFRWYW